MTSHPAPAPVPAALPFWAAFAFVPLALTAAWLGGWWIALLPLYGIYLPSLLDRLLGRNLGNPDPDAKAGLFWHRAATWAWWPCELLVVYGSLALATQGSHLPQAQFYLLAAAVGVVTGGTGIVFAHELMHRKARAERLLGDALMTLVCYGHFRTEHLLVHHRYVGTPRDAVTARYNEGFLRFFPRVLVGCLASAWNVESDRLRHRGLPLWHPTNPFWRYGLWSLAYLLLAVLMAGTAGALFFLAQALVAVLFLELVNYVEHYGLTRRHLGQGRYEAARPHHSWNTDHRFTNYLLINLQRHSDHHFHPNRRFPLLQTFAAEEAPQLPYGYPVMTALALVPPLWFRVMNPKVRAWRHRHYPDIADWSAYKAGTNPMPR